MVTIQRHAYSSVIHKITRVTYFDI